ncbi:MAG: CapA family protein [Candidatus Pacebacteria bacterium]|nr:CapA family protein [Candidatus Paceibacterota bacterium]
MSKRLIFLILIIFASFLFLNKLDSDFLEKQELSYSGIIFSNLENLDQKILLKDSEDFGIDYENNIIFSGNDKYILETYLDSLDCKDNVLVAEYSFTDYDFFNRSFLNNLSNSLYGVYYFSNKCGRSKYIFKDGNLYFEEKGEDIRHSFLFVGDMMFDRGVELLIKQNDDFNYPFYNISNYLKRADVLIGNLEGPIVSTPTFISSNSMSFSFDRKIASVLKENNFSIVSLANNHTCNMSTSGLNETKKYLEDSDVDYIGDPVTCSIDDIVLKNGVVFYAVNKTFDFNCSNEEIQNNVQKIKDKYPDNFLVVLPHFGEEYMQKASLAQEELAHLIIDAGADLIIGGHSHVLQNIEKYKNKLIFYSLGNFIFDQYFSEETQEGLMVGLEIIDEKQIYTLLTIEEIKAQPFLSNKLDFLASISSPEIKTEIEKGEIIIYQKDQ